jgi:hypothetical protein
MHVVVKVVTAYRHLVSNSVKLDLMLVDAVSLSFAKPHVSGLTFVEVATLDVHEKE